MASNTRDAGSGLGMHLIIPVVCLLTAYLVLERCREYWRLRHFKGPQTTGISWWWHSRAVIGGKAHEYYGDVTEKYGAYSKRESIETASDREKDLLQESHQRISLLVMPNSGAGSMALDHHTGERHGTTTLHVLNLAKIMSSRNATMLATTPGGRRWLQE